MKASAPSRWLRRAVGIVVIITHIAACTTSPTGQNVFSGFDQCMAANLGMAAVGGVAAGFLGKAIAGKFTTSNSTANNVAVAGGIAAAVAIGMVAWRKCAAAYSKSEVVAPANSLQPLDSGSMARRRLGLGFDRLGVNVEGNDDTAPAPEFSFTFNANDANEKDIKAVFRHKVEIVRFKSTDDGRLLLTDDKDQPLKDSSGHPIPLEMAQSMPRGRLFWTVIAAEGQQDYVENVVIQQGASALYRHKLQIPPRAQLPLPLPVPMRYQLSVEVGGLGSSRAVDFLILKARDRPKSYPSSVAVNSGEAPPAIPESSDQQADFTATHTVKRKVTLYDRATPPRKAVGTLKARTPVEESDEMQVQVGNASVKWGKVAPEDGPEGWLRASELLEIK